MQANSEARSPEQSSQEHGLFKVVKTRSIYCVIHKLLIIDDYS